MKKRVQLPLTGAGKASNSSYQLPNKENILFVEMNV